MKKEENKKSTTLFLKKEEKLEIENNILKIQNLNYQLESLQKEQQELVRAFCTRNNKTPEAIINFNVQAGTVEFSD